MIHSSQALEETVTPPLPLKLIEGRHASGTYRVQVIQVHTSTSFQTNLPQVLLGAKEGYVTIVYDPDDPKCKEVDYVDERLCRGKDGKHLHLPEFCPPCKAYELSLHQTRKPQKTGVGRKKTAKIKVNVISSHLQKGNGICSSPQVLQEDEHTPPRSVEWGMAFEEGQGCKEGGFEKE